MRKAFVFRLWKFEIMINWVAPKEEKDVIYGEGGHNELTLQKERVKRLMDMGIKYSTWYMCPVEEMAEKLGIVTLKKD